MSKLLEAAQVQFREWTAAFRDTSQCLTIHFTAADCLALCHTLQHHAETGQTCANWYRRQLDPRSLKLDGVEYGEDGRGPTQFDVIDTSNLADHVGLVNMLVSASSLLKDRPWSVLYTDITARDSEGENAKFESHLAGHTRTISVLLGLRPAEYWGNATAVSIFEEYMAAMRAEGEPPRVQSRCGWMLDNHLPTHSKVTIGPEALANTLFKIYQDMFSRENVSLMPRNTKEQVIKWGNMTAYTKYHRGSFVAFVKAVCKNTGTEGSSICSRLINIIASDKTLILGSNHVQDMCLEMSKIGLYSEPWLTEEIRRNMPTAAGFCKWKKIPEAVAVTLVISPAKWKRAYRTTLEWTVGLTVEAHVKSNTLKWHNMYSDVQIIFGTLTARGSRDQDGYSLHVEEDVAGWAGNSPMIATFYAPAAALQVDPRATNVSLCLQTTIQNAQLFQSIFGSQMVIFETQLLKQSDVFVTKHSPGQSGYRVVGGASLAASPKKPSPGEEPCTSLTLSVNAPTGDIAAVTGRLDFGPGPGKCLLEAKASIELRQCSPFTIEVVFGDSELVYPLRYPVPVVKENSKTRIARKSGYVEVVARLADPATSEVLGDFIFPCVLAKHSSLPGVIPTALNIPHVNLDRLPVLDSSDKEKIPHLLALVRAALSRREQRLRDDAIQSLGAKPSVRVAFKDSLSTIVHALPGPQTRAHRRLRHHGPHAR